VYVGFRCFFFGLETNCLQAYWSRMERRSGAVNKNCQKLTRELTSLKNNKAKASKKSKDSENGV
jgi:hypothetical protein